MKTMKPILKLLFVVVLVGMVMSRPQKARADGTEYTCTEPGMYNCTQSATQWMSQCIAGCPKQGSESEFEYYYVVNSGGVYEITEEFYYAPESGDSCYNTCDDEMNSLIEECLSSNCTEE